MATTEFRLFDSNSPIRFDSRAVTKRMSHQTKNSPWSPIIQLPTTMNNSVCIKDNPAVYTILDQI